MNNLTSTVDFDEFHVNLLFERSIHRPMHTYMGKNFEDLEIFMLYGLGKINPTFYVSDCLLRYAVYKLEICKINTIANLIAI